MKINSKTLSFFFNFISPKICWCNNQLLHKASNYFNMAQETKMQTEEKNNAKKMLGKKKLPLKVFKFF